MSERILIIQTAFIGDLILTTPLIRETAGAFPNGVLDVMVSSKAAGLLSGNPHIRKLRVFNKKNRRAELRRLFSEIREAEYDIALIPHESTTSALLAFRAGISVRVGFAGRLSSVLHTVKVPFRKEGLRLEKDLDLLRALKPGTFNRETELFPSSSQRKQADELIRKLPGTGAVIAVAPCSVWPTKCWPVDYYRELAERLVKKGYRLVFTGSAVERELCQGIIPETGSICTAGELTLSETAALVERCDLMICNDSGAMHIADAMKTDVFAFFGPTVEELGYFPHRAGDRVFQVDLDCRPCGKHGGKRCPRGHHNCMGEISPDSVLSAVVERLGK